MSDTIAALQQALTPQTGMRRIPFPLESYQHPSVPLSAKRLLNVMAEAEPVDARTQAALISTPGLVSAFPAGTFGAGPVLAINTDQPGVAYFVSGSHAYGWSGTVWDMGSVGTMSAAGDVNPALIVPATIAVSPTCVVFCVPPNAFVAAHGPVGTTVNQIGGDFPGANSVCYLDGYFIFSQQGYGTTFFISLIDDPSSYDALDFANLEAGSNIILRAITQAGEIWLAGRNGWEVWYDAGAPDFPFRRRQTGGVIQYGVGTARSIAQIDGSVFWVDEMGFVYRSNGYQAVRISTHAIEAIIRSFGNTSSDNVLGLGYAQDGHAFYSMTLSGSRTLVYDCNTKAWHDRASSADGSGPWRASAIGMIQNTVFVGDLYGGNVYAADLTSATDNGVAVLRQTTFPPIYAGTYRAFCSRLEVEMEVGGSLSPGTVDVAWSDDGGITWTGGPRTMNTGAAAETRKRVYTTRLGSFRQRVFRLSYHGHATIYAVDSDVTGGTAG